MLQMRFAISRMAPSVAAFALLVGAVLAASVWSGVGGGAHWAIAGSDLVSRIGALMIGPFFTSAILVAGAAGAALIAAALAVILTTWRPDGFQARLIRALAFVLGLFPAVLLVAAIPLLLRLVAPEWVSAGGAALGPAPAMAWLPSIILAIWLYPAVFRMLLAAVDAPETLRCSQAAGLPMGAMVTGLVIVEVVFQKPGLGMQLADALRAGAGDALSAVVIVLAGAVLLVSALVHGALTALAQRAA